MRHRKQKKILGRALDHRKRLMQNLIKSFIIHEKIRTTDAKAKLLKSKIDWLITLAKKNNLTTKRQLINFTGQNNLANKLLKEVAPRYQNRTSGYTRIIKLNNRKGDGAKMVYIEFIL